MSKKKDPWLQGYAAAVGALAHTFNMPSLAYDVIKSDGLTVEMLTEAGADGLGMIRLKLQETRDQRRRTK